MLKMWWKLFLLTVYITVLFILSRILEAVAYYEGGYLASRLLDPVSLSVRKLKTLLDQRGVSYAGVVEKQELTDLVDSSGEVSEGELEAATLSDDSATSTNFTCGSHFYEEVEDTKDSVWVVQVVRDQLDMFLRHDDWKAFIKKVGRFGVRTGIFDCSLDWRLCDRKRWYTSRLVMALPQGERAKDSVMLRSYTGSTKVQAVFDWVNFNLASRIREIFDYDELQEDWLTYEEGRRHHTKVRVLLFSQMKIPPMFFSVLSVKFTGRAKFGTVNVRTKEGKDILNHLKFRKLPTYLIVTPERNFTFGERSGEYLNYNSMALLLKSLHPEVNDIFLLSLIIVNVTCWFELFITQGGLFKRLGNLLWRIGKWNCCLILLWLPVLGLFQLPYMDLVLNYGLTVLRMLGTTDTAGLVRNDWLWFLPLHCGFLICTFLIFATIVGVLHYIYRDLDPQPAANINNNSDWWNFNWDGYVSYLFRPMATLTRPMGPPDMDLEVGMELLIERLAVPNFWLRPMISSDYIKDLPVWRYTELTFVDSDVCSDGESAKSDGEDMASGAEILRGTRSFDSICKQPYMFICEKCRALQIEKENTKSARDLEEEQMESESACAKFLMDGDYKCLCKCNHKASHSGRHPSRSPTKHRARSLSPENLTLRDVHSSWPGGFAKDRSGEEDPGNQMPPGILPSTECVICLEGYKYGVALCGLPCGHSFHQQCIMGWLSRDNHCCPVCRWPTYKAKPCSIHLHSQ